VLFIPALELSCILHEIEKMKNCDATKEHASNMKVALIQAHVLIFFSSLRL
jgi:hypothetical protein